MDYWLAEVGISRDELKQHPALVQSLRLLAEKAKKALSVQDSFEAEWNGDKLSISKVTFEDLVKGLVDQTLESCRMAVKDAGLKVDEIDE